MTSDDDQRRTDEERERAVVQAIRAYLRQHPNAKDPPDHILTFWLVGEGVPVGMPLLERALRRLVREGFLREEHRAGTVYYALRQSA